MDPLKQLLATIPNMTWEQTDETLDVLRVMRDMADRNAPRFQEFMRDTDLCFRKLGERRYEIVRITRQVARRLTGE